MACSTSSDRSSRSLANGEFGSTFARGCCPDAERDRGISRLTAVWRCFSLEGTSSDRSARGGAGGGVAASRASANVKVEDGSECFLFRARSETEGLTPTSPGGPCVPMLERSPEGSPLRLNWVFRPAARRERALFSSRHTSIRSASFAPPPALDVSEDVDSASGEAAEASLHEATAGASSGGLSARARSRFRGAAAPTQ